MSNIHINQNGLTFSRIGNYNLILDPDNVFWGISKPLENGDALFSRKVFGLYNRIQNSLDRQMQEFRFGTDLSAIYIDPTDRCNANCPYCYIPQEMRKNGAQMSREDIRVILNKIYQEVKGRKKKLVIIFHAAEPLLAKEAVFRAIEEFKDKFHFGLQTNATLLTKNDVDFLKKHHVGVGVSLDSFNQKINNRLRVNTKEDNFSKVVRALEWFNGYAGLNVITTVTKLNVRDLPGIVRFLYAKKVPCVLLNPVRLTQKNSRFLKPDEKQMAKYFVQAVDTAISLSQKSQRRIVVGNFANVLLAILSPQARRLMCDISPCGGGRCFFTITASGKMIPCGEFIGLAGFSGGNIFKDSISKAMEGAAFRKIRSRFVEKIPECDICALRNICGAPCPAELHALGGMYPVRSKSSKINQQASNGMYQKAIFCEFYKEIIQYAFKIIAEGKEKCCFRKEGFKNFEYEYQLSE